jgi:hypothetical protein
MKPENGELERNLFAIDDYMLGVVVNENGGWEFI